MTLASVDFLRPPVYTQVESEVVVRVGQVTFSNAELAGAIARQREIVAGLLEVGGWRLEVEELALEMMEAEVA